MSLFSRFDALQKRLYRRLSSSEEKIWVQYVIYVAGSRARLAFSPVFLLYMFDFKRMQRCLQIKARINRIKCDV
jgi:hypothetical protein